MNERTSIRDRHKAQTRGEILRAFAECLEEADGGEVSVTRVAQRAGVSDKTVYRHFPTRVDLMAEFGVWYENETFPLLPLPSLTDLPAVFAQAAATFDERPRLSQAMALSTVGREALSGFHEQILEQLEAALTDAAPGLTPPERRRYVAALHYLDNIFAWVTLRDRFGMDAAEIGDVVGWLIQLVIDSLPPEPA